MAGKKRNRRKPKVSTVERATVIPGPPTELKPVSKRRKRRPANQPRTAKPAGQAKQNRVTRAKVRQAVRSTKKVQLVTTRATAQSVKAQPNTTAPSKKRFRSRRHTRNTGRSLGVKVVWSPIAPPPPPPPPSRTRAPARSPARQTVQRQALQLQRQRNVQQTRQQARRRVRGKLEGHAVRVIDLARRIASRGRRLSSGAKGGPTFQRDLLSYDMPADLEEAIAQSKAELERDGMVRLREAIDFRLRNYIPAMNCGYEDVPQRGKALHDLLWAEEAIERHELRQFDVEDAAVTRIPLTNRWRVPVEGLAEKRPSVIVGDSLLLYDTSEDRVHEGSVHYVLLDAVEVSLHDSVSALHGPVNVYFIPNRSQFRLLHRAIDDAKMDFSAEMGFRMRGVAPMSYLYPDMNVRQQHFLDTIFCAPKRLHLLWGPPGTGKTSTLVDSVAALAAANPPHFKFLIATPSNAAADHFAVQLVEKHAQLRRRVVRLQAPSRPHREVPSAVLSVSNSTEGTSFAAPVLSDLKKIGGGPIVVVTLSTAARLYSIGVQPFDVIVIDEAGQATETDFLLVTPMTHPRTRFLVAGDPAQLGPVRSPILAPYALAKSPLARLIDNPSIPTTMLEENYRNVPDILDLFNPFYDNRLVPRSAPRRSDYAFFASEHFGGPLEDPVPGAWFVDCRGKESRVRGSPSWMNEDEAIVACALVEVLLSAPTASPHDIVLLTPYLQQVRRIKEAVLAMVAEKPYLVSKHGSFEPGHCPVRVCTVEQFQGKEAPVIIMSCVRSVRRDEIRHDVRQHLGFLMQQERLNVALSRAESLLIIVGNCELLKLHDEWRRLINCLEDRRCVIAPVW